MHLSFERLDSQLFDTLTPMFLGLFEDIKRALHATLDWKKFKLFQDTLHKVAT
jgi:hypothetical protein